MHTDTYIGTGMYTYIPRYTHTHIYRYKYVYLWGFPRGARSKESDCQCRRCKRHWFNS